MSTTGLGKALNRRDVAWGYAANVSNITGWILLLPLVLRYLSVEEVGLWFVFLTMVGLFQLLEMGFQPTIARNAAYVYAGAQELKAEGLRKSSLITTVCEELLQNLFLAARSVYLVVSLLAAVVLLAIGSSYVVFILPETLRLSYVLGSWFCFSAGQIITLYFGYVSALLQGRGDITQANKALIVSKGLLVLVGSLLLASGYGLLGLGLAALLGAAAGRWILFRFYYRGALEQRACQGRMSPGAYDVRRVLWHNAKRLGAVQFGGFLIVRANTLISSYFLGLGITGSYGLSLNLLVSLSGVASMVGMLQLPAMNALQALGQKVELRRAFGRGIAAAWIVFVIGAAVLLGTSEQLLAILQSNTPLLEVGPLLALAFVMFLEMTHSLSASYLTTHNVIPFVRAALVSGAMTVILGVILIGGVGTGVWGLILAQGLTQAAYNNWKWPMMAIKDLNARPTILLRNGALDLFSLLRRG